MVEYTEHGLREIIKKSETLHEVLSKLKRNKSSNSYKVLRKRIDEWDIDVSHFLTRSEAFKKYYKKGVMQKLPDSEIFINGSLVSRATVKRRIIEGSLIEYSCCRCGNSGKWRDKEMVLILDHKNGIRDDNTFSNLRFLCPNCNSQEPTHCIGSKALAEKEIKETRDKKINPTEKERAAHLKSRKVKDRPSKEQLALELKSSNYTALGRKYKVSDNCIRKWLR